MDNQHPTKKIAIVVGTRPEIIKMAPIIRYCEREKIRTILIHTGQHYSYDMDRIFFHDLKLPEPSYNLEVGSHSHGKQTGLLLMRLEEVLIEEKPSIVLVEGISSRCSGRGGYQFRACWRSDFSENGNSGGTCRSRSEKL